MGNSGTSRGIRSADATSRGGLVAVTPSRRDAAPHSPATRQHSAAGSGRGREARRGSADEQNRATLRLATTPPKTAFNIAKRKGQPHA